MKLAKKHRNLSKNDKKTAVFARLQMQKFAA